MGVYPGLTDAKINYVIDKIRDKPLVGFGRLGMKRSGLQQYIGKALGEGDPPGHPHNMYLEALLDNGILGSIVIFLFCSIF